MSAQPEELAHRDYPGEMRAVIDAEMQPGDSAPLVAARIVAKLRATDPDLLAGWLDAAAVGFVREAIGAIDRSARGKARRGPGAKDFAEHADKGDVSGWLAVSFVVDDEQARKPLGDLYRPELLVNRAVRAAIKAAEDAR